MSEKPFEEALDRVLDNLLNYPIKHNPPEILLKKNDLAISVSHEFNQDRLKIEGKRYGIVIKLIAKYEEWVDLELKYLADQINAADTYNVIEHFIPDKTPISSQEKLKDYAANHPEAFLLDIYECAVCANAINPEDKKYRHHALPKWQGAKKAACELYYWMLANYQSNQDKVKRVFKKYEYTGVVRLGNLKSATWHIIRNQFKLTNDPDINIHQINFDQLYNWILTNYEKNSDEVQRVCRKYGFDDSLKSTKNKRAAAKHMLKLDFELDKISKSRFYHTFIYGSLLSSQRLRNSWRIREGNTEFLNKILS